jgi:hypothetical protein
VALATPIRPVWGWLPPLGQKWGGPATPFFGQGVAPATPIFFFLLFFKKKKKKILKFAKLRRFAQNGVVLDEPKTA